jgi:HlyD family secretion protein
LTVSQRALEHQGGAGLLTRGRMLPIVLGLIAVLLALLIVHDVFFPPAPAGAAVNTATVTMGNVQSAVSGTGTVVPAQQQNLNFGQSGTLAELDVKVGDHVTKGQVVARLDPTQLQQALQQAQNSLTQAQATLSSTVNGNAVTQAQHNLAAAQQTLGDTRAQVNLTGQQDASTLAQDQNQLDNVDAPALAQAQRNLADFNAANPADNCSSPAPPQQCTQLNSAITQAQNAVNQDNVKILADQNRIATDQLSGQRSIDQATATVTTAQDNLDGQTITRPNTIASQQAAVSTAQLQVQTAQRNLDMATLTAPFDGTVQSINGVVGEPVSSGGGSTSLAPGSSAPQPSSSGASGGGAGGAGSTGSTGTGASSGGSSVFMVLGDVSAMQVVAPFAEADASRLAVNQQATVTFDAVSGVTLPAHVLAVASTATVVSNVTNYYATLVLDQIDSRLKSGMTANANVTVQSATNVLTVPNSVITRIGGAAFVTLLGRDGKQTRVPVQTGAAGDTFTEIRGGLNVGDRVVRPQLRAGTTGAAGAAGGRGAFGGGGGGGGVRIGGGG